MCDAINFIIYLNVMKLGDFYKGKTLREWIEVYPEFVLDVVYRRGIDVSPSTYQKIQAAVIEKWERINGKGYFIAIMFTTGDVGIKYRSPVYGKHFNSLEKLVRFKRLLRRLTKEDIKFVIYSSEGFENYETNEAE